MISQILKKTSRDDIMTLAAALALYTAFALAPLTILLITFLGTLELNLQNQLIDQVRILMGTEAAKIFETVVKGATDRPDLRTIAGWTSAITLVVSASVIFAQIQYSLNRIFETHHKKINPQSETWYADARKFALQRLFTFGLVLVFVLVSIVSLVASSALSFILSNQSNWLAGVASAAINIFVFSILFASIFKWIPERSIHFATVFKGGIVTAILFVLGKSIIGIYIGRAAVGSAYGAAGSLVVLLFWAYYSSLIVFVGAEISAFLVNRKELPAT